MFIEARAHINKRPDNWVAMPLDSSGKEVRQHLGTLSPTSAEYKKVQDEFNKTMPSQSSLQPHLSSIRNNKIISIQVVQNVTLYGRYAGAKLNMEQHNSSTTAIERLLWHGTSPDTTDKINSRGFDRGFAGKNGKCTMNILFNLTGGFCVATIYGRGAYFARDASYSHRYASPDVQGVRRMYLANVLTGEYTLGNASMLVPPAKDPSLDPTDLFDSTVDNAANPTIFVIYTDVQSYPAYLVTYM